MTSYETSLDLALASEDAGSLRSWVHLLPKGRFYGRDGRGPYYVEDLDGIIQRSRDDAGKVQMVVDYHHSTDLLMKAGRSIGEPAPAAGWITALQRRDNGIWGLVEWTARAAQLLKDREYRYLSPAMGHDKNGRVLCIRRASLVHDPDLDQLTALASAEEGTMERSLRQKIIETMELDAVADDATILTAITLLLENKALHETQQPDPAKFVPIGDFERAVSEVRRLDQGISMQAAETYVADQIGRARLLPWMKEWAIALCCTNKPALDEFISKTNPALQSMLTPLVPSVFPSNTTSPEHGDIEAEVCRRMGISVEDYRKSNART